MMMDPCFLIHILIMVFNSGFELVYCSWDSVGVSEEGEEKYEACEEELCMDHDYEYGIGSSFLGGNSGLGSCGF